MTFEEYIEKRFAKNLELAREETPIIGPNDEDYECRAWRIATDITQEEIAADIARYLGQKWAARQEAINKVFYG